MHLLCSLASSPGLSAAASAQHPGAHRGLVLSALEAVLAAGTASTAAVNILVDALPSTPSDDECFERASSVFLLAVREQRHRLAVKVRAHARHVCRRRRGARSHDFPIRRCTVVQVAAAYRLTHLPAAVEPELLSVVAELLDSRGGAASGVGLLMQFPSLQRHFDVPGVLEDLCIRGQEPLAGRWAGRALGKTEQSMVVQYCLRHDKLRSACRFVEDFELQGEFPDVRALYRAQTLAKLAGKGLWGVAAGVVQGDAALQVSLIQSMLVAGEVVLAQEYCSMFDLDFGSFNVDEAALEVERQRRREQYLQLRLPAECVHFVDTLAALEAMSAALEALVHRPPHHTAVDPPAAASQPQADAHLVRAVALDVEWKPGPDNGSAASLLQLALDDRVFVIDLLALSGRPQALSAALQPVMLAPDVYKLGVGLSGDFRKLAASYPAVAAFRAARGCLELTTLWRARHGTGVTRKRDGEISLSKLAQALLGKELDKSMQVG